MVSTQYYRIHRDNNNINPYLVQYFYFFRSSVDHLSVDRDYYSYPAHNQCTLKACVNFCYTSSSITFHIFYLKGLWPDSVRASMRVYLRACVLRNLSMNFNNIYSMWNYHLSKLTWHSSINQIEHAWGILKWQISALDKCLQKLQKHW